MADDPRRPDFTPWEVLDEQRVLGAAPWLDVYRQRVRLPEGKVVDDYYRVRLPEYVIVVALTVDDEVLMLRGYRHGAGRTTLGVVGGLMEQGEQPLETARRELLEETGYAGGRWSALGAHVPHSNYGCGVAHLYLVAGVEPRAEACSGDLEQTEVLAVPRRKVLELLRRGEISSLSNVAALAVALNPLLYDTQVDRTNTTEG